ALYEKTRNVATSWSPAMRASLEPLYGADGLQALWTKYCDAMREVLKQGGDICKHILPNIKCPTLIVQGDKDAITPPEHATFIASRIARSRLHTFPGWTPLACELFLTLHTEGKHNVHLKYAVEFNKAVSEFFTE